MCNNIQDIYLYTSTWERKRGEGGSCAVLVLLADIQPTVEKILTAGLKTERKRGGGRTYTRARAWRRGPGWWWIAPYPAARKTHPHGPEKEQQQQQHIHREKKLGRISFPFLFKEKKKNLALPIKNTFRHNTASLIWHWNKRQKERNNLFRTTWARNAADASYEEGETRVTLDSLILRSIREWR